jgi:hypothetical protein
MNASQVETQATGTQSVPANGPVLKARQQDERLFRLVFMVSFPLFLLVGIAARLMPAAPLSGLSEAKPRGSLLAEATAAARSTIAVAFAD